MAEEEVFPSNMMSLNKDINKLVGSLPGSTLNTTSSNNNTQSNQSKGEQCQNGHVSHQIIFIL